MAEKVTPQTWAATLLRALKIPQTPGAVQALTGWARAEGGHWNNDAKYNPLNTTQNMPGAGNTGSQGNIKVYKSLQQGVDATVKTLQNGRYEKILSALRSGNPNAVGSAIGQTPWGTTGDLVQRTIASTPRVAGIHALGIGAGGAAPGGGQPGQNPSVGATNTSTTTAFDQAGYDKAKKLTILGNYLAQRNPNSQLLKLGVATPGALPNEADFKTLSTNVAATPLTDHVTGRGYSGTTASLIQTLTDNANALDKKRLPYVYGGGHNKKRIDPKTNMQPLDCSSTVSAVLGVDVRVSGEFAKWGKPGKGRVTVYSNAGHVLMEINGHFFGTSGSNPGGGAGWIPRSQISSSYLKGFTARHIDA